MSQAAVALKQRSLPKIVFKLVHLRSAHACGYRRLGERLAKGASGTLRQAWRFGMSLAAKQAWQGRAGLVGAQPLHRWILVSVSCTAQGGPRRQGGSGRNARALK